ncbi:MAG: branched-chain alpha-keto acid dehydrogenase subunit E2, partial [Acidobacteria bacterium]|nr:branched-chain alpha-keto acid dehydrogenase subunit E2 [Acidobacteriota bacterium]
MALEFKVPELGENVEKGDVVRVMVKAGDVIAVDQAVFELETDKATIEVPSNVAGTVGEVRIKKGDKVKPGQVVLTVEGPAPVGVQRPESSVQSPEVKAPAPVVNIATARPVAVAAAVAVAPVVASGSVELALSIPAAPSVRRFARELGVEIAQVAGTGPGGRIGQDDVSAYVKAQLTSGPATSGGSMGARGYSALPDFSKWGVVESKPMSNIRRKTAEHLAHAWQAPHVTQNDKADLSGFDAFRDTFGGRVEKAGGKLTITAVVIKVLAAGIDRYPQFASSVDMANEAVVYKQYRHIGVAVDTPNGLLVPVIRDVNAKTVTQITVELAAL